MKILVTGASGFIGKSLVAELLSQGYSVSAGSRTPIGYIKSVVVGDIDGDTDWDEVLVGLDTVIHLAARVHILNENSKDPLAEFRKVNVAGTLKLAKSAAKAGIKRFLFVSSIGVNGTYTTLPYTELDLPNPQDAYGVSKFEAEQALHKLSAKTDMEMVIVRPPLVYGVGVKGNFWQMLKVLTTGIPLPFLSVKNKRSFIYLENLVDALILCATHPKAAGQTYLVSDGQDISTPDLLRRLSSLMGRSAILLPCSPVFMSLVGRLFGKSKQLNKLVGSLQIDSSKIRCELGWKPPFTLDEGLKATAAAYLEK